MCSSRMIQMRIILLCVMHYVYVLCICVWFSYIYKSHDGLLQDETIIKERYIYILYTYIYIHCVKSIEFTDINNEET